MPSPVFIVGVQRSGTTLLRLMINAHPNICIPFETVFITEFFGKLTEYGDVSNKQSRRRLLNDIRNHPFVIKGNLIKNDSAILERGDRTYSELIDSIFTEYAYAKGKARWGDKTPSYLEDMDILWKLFPDAKFIHMVRDGRDVALSMSSLSWGSRHVPSLALQWKEKVELAHKMGQFIGKNYLEVRYEDLVRDTEQTLRKICEFLEEPYSPLILDYHATAIREMPRESLVWHQSSVSQINRKKVFNWKSIMSSSDQVIYSEIASETLRQFGYDLPDASSNFYSKMKTIYYYTVRRW